jgi:hypothetical protein
MSEEGSERSSLPWIMAALVLVIGGAKLDSARPLVARALAIAIPVVPVLIGVKRIEGSRLEVERAAHAIGWVTILAGEACVASGFFQVRALDAVAPLARIALYGAAAAALVVHTLDARIGSKARFAPFIGMAGAGAIYLSSHPPSADAFSAVLGAFFAALFIGGGAGLMAGELLGRAFKKA